MKQHYSPLWDLDKLVMQSNRTRELFEESGDGAATIKKWLALADCMLDADL
jgi:hypothetical protein